MTEIMLVDGSDKELEQLRIALETQSTVTTRVCRTGSEALKSAREQKTDVAIISSALGDGDGLLFAREFTKAQPLVNCALVSSLEPETFHEATEGLGVFMQLPENPGPAEAENMLQLLESIQVLLTM